MFGRALLISGVLGLAACSGCASTPPTVLPPPPPPGNIPRITAQLICHEVWQQPPPPFGDGSFYNVVYWKWSTVDGNAHVQVQDTTNVVVTKDFIIPLGGGAWWQRLTQGSSGRVMWENAPNAWTQVASFPGDWPLPPRCTWVVPPI